MEINIEEIKKVAKLAKFDITEQEAELYTKQLSAVLDWVNQLKNVDTSSVKYKLEVAPARQREDTPVLSPCAKDVTAAFNEREDNFLKVKKVL
jgi:aspartyl/glutamyl-tRNA(Asn/Gln) amidotransferase, C subunit